MDIQKCLLILELKPPLTPAQAHRAYRRMVKRWHPDQFAHQPAIHTLAEERLKSINRAYTIVKDHIKAQSDIEIPPENSRSAIKRPSTLAPKPMAQATANRPQHVGKKVPAAPGSASPGGRPRSTLKQPASSFERILREASQTKMSSPNPGNTGARPMFGLHPGRRRKKGLRIEGSASITPLQPVRPISKVRPI